MKRLLVANRSEIAIRIFRAATELGLSTIAVYAEEDKLSLHRFKADEAYLIGKLADGSQLGPVEAYLSIDEIMRVAREANADAIHPGYGFLSENRRTSPRSARQQGNFDLHRADPTMTIRKMGLKTEVSRPWRQSGESRVDVPGDADGADHSATPRPPSRRLAAVDRLPRPDQGRGWGGGGQAGCGSSSDESELIAPSLRSRPSNEAEAAFGKNSSVYLEKFIDRPRHVEVQLLADSYGNARPPAGTAIARSSAGNQKLVERVARADTSSLEVDAHRARRGRRPRIAKAVGYVNAGTCRVPGRRRYRNKFYFIEVNPRIQVEHTVTEVVTGIDIVKAQINIMEGGHIGTFLETGVPAQADITLNGHAIQCRITTEDPDNNFTPGLRPHHRLPRRLRLRRPRRRRHRLFGRGRHPLVRFAAGKDHRLGADAAGGDPAHAARAARVPDPRRGDQPRLPRPHSQPPQIRRQLVHDEVHRRDAGTAGLSPPPRSSHAAAHLHRRRQRQRSSRDQEPTEAGRRGQASHAAQAGRARAAGLEAGVRQRRRQRPRRLDAQRDAPARHRHGDARRPPVAAGHAHALVRHRRHGAGLCRATAAAVQPRMLGAVPPSTSPCASSARTRGSAWRRSAPRSPTSCCRCCCAAPTASATPTTPTTSCGTSPRRRRPRASTSFASSIA